MVDCFTWHIHVVFCCNLYVSYVLRVPNRFSQRGQEIDCNDQAVFEVAAELYLSIFHHLKLEFALSIPASNVDKYIFRKNPQNLNS